MKHLTSYIFLIIAFLLLGVNGAAAQEKDCPFKVAVVGDNTDISYDNKVLSIRSSDKVTITGDGSLTDWGIEIESRGRLVVTIEDLNIEREGVPLKIKRRVNFSIIIEGTVCFERLVGNCRDRGRILYLLTRGRFPDCHRGKWRWQNSRRSRDRW